MWLARRIADAHIVLTDLPYLLPLTERNVRQNFPEGAATSRPVVSALRWGCRADLASMPRAADLVIAAD
eukprot:7108744-Prymnesium_polylepis.1